MTNVLQRREESKLALVLMMQIHTQNEVIPGVCSIYFCFKKNIFESSEKVNTLNVNYFLKILNFKFVIDKYIKNILVFKNISKYFHYSGNCD